MLDLSNVDLGHYPALENPMQASTTSEDNVSTETKTYQALIPWLEAQSGHPQYIRA